MSTGTEESTNVTVNVTNTSEVHIQLSQDQMADCFMQTIMNKAEFSPLNPDFFEANRTYRKVYAPKGSILIDFSFRKHQLSHLRKGCHTLNDRDVSDSCCSLQIEVPRGQYIALAIREHSGSRIRLSDTILKRDIYKDFKVSRDNYEHSRIFMSSSNIVNILQSMEPNMHGKVHRAYIRFQAVGAPDFEIKRFTMTKGVFQTVLYEGPGLLLIPVVNPWCSIPVPSGHLVLLSCRTFEHESLRVALYAGDRGNATLAFFDFYYSYTPPCAAVYNTSQLVIRTEYPSVSYQMGFQLQFSFHNESALPKKIIDYMWNCSVPHTSDFMHHLFCNKVEECPDAVDEANCSYTSDLCGPGYLTMGGACFFYVWRPWIKFSWNEAREVCSLRGGRLPVLNTPDKWKDAIRLLPNSRTYAVEIFLGIQSTPPTLPLWYARLYQWTDATTAVYLHSEKYYGFVSCYSNTKSSCGYVTVHIISDKKVGHVCAEVGCELKARSFIICEKPIPSQSSNTAMMNATNHWPSDSTYVECPSGHYTHEFLVCDVKTSCWYREDSSRCDSSLTPLPPSFTCIEQTNRVPYTLVCDHRADCADGSDETFCDFDRCQFGYFSCDNGQCILSTYVCNGWGDCQNREDEERCEMEYDIQTNVPPPALFNLHDNGQLVVKPLDSGLSSKHGLCPHTHFQCPDTEYCLPSILRCNGAYDCPGREDEVDCEACPGFYRCRASKVCLQYRELCDGHPHCPQHDDELMCNATCPVSCACRGLAFFCKHSFATSAYPLLRFLNASGSAVTPAHLNDNRLLIHLILANCGLTSLYELFLPNLLILDTQDNQLSSLSSLHLVGMPQLKVLSVAGNPLMLAFQGTEVQSFPQVVNLDVSRVQLHDFNVTLLSAFPKLRVLNLSHSGVQRVQGDGFRSVESLREIDLRGCPMKWFPFGMFQGLGDLQAVYAHNVKVCCPEVLPPKFSISNCYAPSSVISPCGDLLNGNGYSISAFVLSLLALIGNAVNFVFRTFMSKRETKQSYRNFVSHLAVSDFLMGVYLAIIGVANQVYRGMYLWNDVSWRHSVSCKLAGFLFFLSTETSVFIMCLITLDRFLVLRFPFGWLQFSPMSAHVACAIVWIGGVVLASVPLLPLTSQWDLYSQTGLCVPLPITRTDFPGQSYSFSLLIVINLVVFVFIGLAQLRIYWSISTNCVFYTTKKTKDLVIARRLITMALTDFLSWFPVGVLGLLASTYIPFPGEVNVAVALIVLPFNAAVNPCLYTFNVIMEHRSRAREEKLRALLLAQLKARK